MFDSGDEGHNLGYVPHASYGTGRPDMGWGQMEEPQYADINDAELREIEAEVGHPVTRELAHWFIRNRINREAVERMMGATNRMGMCPDVRNVRNIEEATTRKPVSTLKKVKKKCA
jgi:hypothetical protein